MSGKVDLQRLGAVLDDYGFAYLVTVDDDYHAHAVTVEPVLCDADEGIVTVGPIGGHTRRNLSHHRDTTLVWPPSDPGGYSLMVDGRAQPICADDDRLRIVPTRALLHRRADSDSAAAENGCLHDCVVLAES